MIRFLADADLNHVTVKGCRRREPTLDFLPANEANFQGVPDPDVLAFAAVENRILVTHDHQTMPGHFGDFLIRGRASPGVFLVSQHAPIADVIEDLVLIWTASDASEWRDRIVNIAEPSAQ
jgi:hypothetical protein